MGKNINSVIGALLYRTTDVRCWVGIFDNTTIANSDTVPSNNYAAFRFSTGIGVTDAHWQCCTRDGSTQNVVATTVAADTNQHTFGIQCDDANSKVNFFIDGVLVGTSIANLPVATTVMNLGAVNLWHTTDPSAPFIGLGHMQVMSDW
jgi:hypothetical protein